MTNKIKKVYQTPKLIVHGDAAKLIQGNTLNGPYNDRVYVHGRINLNVDRLS